MSKNYTTKTASLRATQADIGTLKVKNLIIDGEISSGGGNTGSGSTSNSNITLPDDYYKFIGRTQLTKSSSYKLIDDDANVIYNNSNA